MNFKKFQFAGTPNSSVLAEKGEVYKSPNGQIQQIAQHAPSHDDGEQINSFGIKPTAKGNGGVVVNAESVLSDSYSQVSTGSRPNSMKEQIVKIKADEGEMIASQLGLDIRLKKSVSPSKLFLEIQEAKDKIALKIMKASEKTQKTRESSNALQANQAQLMSLPTDEEIYEAIFHTQEEKKENSSLDFDDESTSQYGGAKMYPSSTQVSRTIVPFFAISLLGEKEAKPFDSLTPENYLKLAVDNGKIVGHDLQDIQFETTKPLHKFNRGLDEKYRNDKEFWKISDLKYNQRHNQKIPKSMLDDILDGAIKSGVDPYDALAIAQRESGFGNNYSFDKAPKSIFSNWYEDVQLSKGLNELSYKTIEQAKKYSDKNTQYPFASEMNTIKEKTKKYGLRGYNYGDPDYPNKIAKEKEIMFSDENKEFRDYVNSRIKRKQYGGSTYVQKPINPFQIQKNQRDILEEEWNNRQSQLSTTKKTSPAIQQYYKNEQAKKEANERINNRQNITNAAGMALAPVPVLGEIYNTANTIANGVVDVAQGEYADVAASLIPFGISKYRPKVRTKDWNTLDSPKGNLYGEYQTIVQQQRLLNPEIKKKFFEHQASIENKTSNMFAKPRKDIDNRITTENYEDFVNDIHNKTEYDLSSVAGKQPYNLGVGNYGKSGMVFKDAPLNPLQKDIINAHEKNHGIFAGTLSDDMRKGLMSPFGGIGNKAVKGYKDSAQADEVLARMGQFKNAVGISDNQPFTLGHLNLIRSNYANKFIDNGISDMLSKIPVGSKAEKLFLENMNKYAFGAAGVGAMGISQQKQQYGGAHYNKNLNYILPNSLLDEKNEDVEEPVFKLKKKEIKGDKRNGYSAYEQNGEIYMDNINDEPIKQHETFHYLRSKGYFSPREQAIENELLDGSIYSPLDKNKLNSDIYSPEELAARFHSISGYLPNNYKEEDFKKLWETGKDLQIQDLKQVIPYDKALYYMNNYHPSKMQMGGMVSKDSSNLKEIKKQRDWLRAWYGERDIVTEPIEIFENELKSVNGSKTKDPEILKQNEEFRERGKKTNFDVSAYYHTPSDRSVFLKDVTGTTDPIHEFTHSIDNNYGDNIGTFNSINPFHPLKTDYTKLGVKPIKENDYFTNTEETYARLNEARYSSGYAANYKPTLEDIKEQRRLNKKNKPKAYNHLFDYYDDNSIMQMWNGLSDTRFEESSVENPMLQQTAKYGIKKQFGGGSSILKQLQLL